MQAKSLPTQEFLDSCFKYNKFTGELIWKVRSECSFPLQENRTPSHIANAWNAAWSGKLALASKAKNGYLRGTINGQFYYAHRIIYKLVYGVEPDDIDHEDGNRSNNKLKNLIDKSRQNNLKNRALSSNNTSGTHGVSYSNRHKLWAACIYHSNERIHLGWFKDKDLAIAARKEAELLYQYHPNHGRLPCPVSARFI